MRQDGYDLDDKRKKNDKSDLQDIVTQYHNRGATSSSDQERENNYFSISKQEIVDNSYDLSLSKYRSEVYEEVTYEAPEVIFERLETIEESIVKGIRELKEFL